MSNDVHLPHQWIDKQDANFFLAHPDRQSHIRKPFGDESKGEFWSLGDHNRDRRRILLWRVPPDSPHYDPRRRAILKIPFLLFADETVEDTDDIVLPIIHEVMLNAAKSHGM